MCAYVVLLLSYTHLYCRYTLYLHVLSVYLHDRVCIVCYVAHILRMAISGHFAGLRRRSPGPLTLQIGIEFVQLGMYSTPKGQDLTGSHPLPPIHDPRPRFTSLMHLIPSKNHAPLTRTCDLGTSAAPDPREPPETTMNCQKWAENHQKWAENQRKSSQKPRPRPSASPASLRDAAAAPAPWLAASKPTRPRDPPPPRPPATFIQHILHIQHTYHMI